MAENFILFTLAGTTYAVRTSEVAHIEMIEHVTGVPNAAHFVDGVVFSRGQVVPALNLRARFGFEKAAYDLSHAAARGAARRPERRPGRRFRPRVPVHSAVGHPAAAAGAARA